LRDEIGGISEKMLAQTLRSLERDGLVERHSFPVVPPHVEYRLTPLGRECARRVWSLVDWIETHALNLERAQVAYDQDCAPAVGGSYAGVIPAERNASRAG
jgi:DNA-binding HxlR family transcriptional regulator